jgi:hypothetical protein
MYRSVVFHAVYIDLSARIEFAHLLNGLSYGPTTTGRKDIGSVSGTF